MLFEESLSVDITDCSNVDIESQSHDAAHTPRRDQIGRNQSDDDTSSTHSHALKLTSSPLSYLWTRLPKLAGRGGWVQETASRHVQLAWRNIFQRGGMPGVWIMNLFARPKKMQGSAKYLKEAIQGDVQVKLTGAPSRRPLKHADQALFICFDRGRNDQFAVKVPCFRPTRHRSPEYTWSKELQEGGRSISWHRWSPVERTEKARESGYQTVQRIRETFESELGWWVKWIPCYGAVKADIVKVSELQQHTLMGKRRIESNPQSSSIFARQTLDADVYRSRLTSDGMAHCSSKKRRRNTKE